MIVIERTIVLIMIVCSLMVALTGEMFTYKSHKAQLVMLFIVMIVMRNEFRNKRKGMRCFARQSNHQDKEKNKYLF